MNFDGQATATTATSDRCGVAATSSRQRPRQTSIRLPLSAGWLSPWARLCNLELIELTDSGGTATAGHRRRLIPKSPSHSQALRASILSTAA